jgi:hypothetical protein
MSVPQTDPSEMWDCYRIRVIIQVAITFIAESSIQALLGTKLISIDKVHSSLARNCVHPVMQCHLIYLHFANVSLDLEYIEYSW